MDRYEELDRQLSEHKIQSVRFVRTQTCYPRLHGRNAAKGVHGYGNMIIAAELTTDRNVRGWGSAVCAYDPEIPSFPRPEIVGLRVTDIFCSGQGILDGAHSVYDIALHDLAGKILNLPVSHMLNQQAVSYVNVYDGAIYMNDLIHPPQLLPLESVIDDCAADYALGHRAFKIKIGRGFEWLPWEEGFARDVLLVRETARRWPDAQIMVDANDGYTPEQMIRFLQSIYPAKLYWIEEPFAEEEKANAQLKEYLRVGMPGCMLADGENRPDIPKLLGLHQKGLLDVLQPDVVDFGFSKWRALMNQLEALGAFGSPHAWGDIVKTYYCAHLAAAYPRHIPTIEAVLGTTEGVDHSGYTLSNGILTIPSAPGFGMELFRGETI